jgi:heat shock protein HslJ
MIKILTIFSSLLFIQMLGCEDTSVQSPSKLEGKWLFKEFFLSDATMLGCGWEAEDVRPMTLEITKEGKAYKLNGAAPVNNYFGEAELLSFDETTANGKVKIGPVGSTKMAGPEPLMQCETMYLQMLQEATDIGFRDSGELMIGRFRTPESNPRDGGTYMVFERFKDE